MTRAWPLALALALAAPPAGAAPVRMRLPRASAAPPVLADSDLEAVRADLSHGAGTAGADLSPGGPLPAARPRRTDLSRETELVRADLSPGGPLLAARPRRTDLSRETELVRADLSPGGLLLAARPLRTGLSHETGLTGAYLSPRRPRLASLPAEAAPPAEAERLTPAPSSPASALGTDAADAPEAAEPAPPPAAEPPAPPAPVVTRPEVHVPPDLSLTPPLPPHPMRLRPAVDVPVLAVSAAIGLGTELVGEEQRWAGCGACDPAAINGLDRRVLGNADPRAALASDVLLGFVVAAPFLADLGDALGNGRRAPRHAAAGWAKDAVVLLEVAAVNIALTNLVKFAVRRPRPYSYDADSTLADPTENDARLSFFSGHSSLAFAMATAYGYLFTTRHPRSRAQVPVWMAGMGLAATTALLRVEAGKHFWTDVIAGALAGAAVGVLVPALHRVQTRTGRPLSAGLGPTPRGALLTLQGRF